MRRSPPVPQFVVSPSQGEQLSVSPPIDLRQTLVESFLSARELQPNSVRSYQQDLQQFMDWCNRPWNSVSQRQVIGFKTYLMDERQLSQNTVRRVLQTLKSFYRWMALSGHVTSDPTKGVQLPEAEEAESQELSDIEVEQIYQAVQQSKFPERNRALPLAHAKRVRHGALTWVTSGRSIEVECGRLSDADGRGLCIEAVAHSRSESRQHGLGGVV